MVLSATTNRSSTMAVRRSFCVLFIFLQIISALSIPESENNKNAAASRVLGGWEAQAYQIPYQVSIRMVSTEGAVSACGGSLIDHMWVITAAHCIRSRRTFVVRVGSPNLISPGYIVETSTRFVHPDFVETNLALQTDDIGLLRLEDYLPYSMTLQPVRLQNSVQKDLDYSGQVFTVSGFGYTDDVWNGGEPSEVLRWTQLEGISLQECQTLYPTTAIIKEQLLCAVSYNQTGRAACQEDSGGPLTVLDFDGQPTLVGIFSFGSSAGCNSPWPTAYVRPGHYLDWIRDVTGINFDWRQTGNSWSAYPPV